MGFEISMRDSSGRGISNSMGIGSKGVNEAVLGLVCSMASPGTMCSGWRSGNGTAFRFRGRMGGFVREINGVESFVVLTAILLLAHSILPSRQVNRLREYDNNESIEPWAGSLLQTVNILFRYGIQ